MANERETFVNLVNMCLGASILSMPWCFAGSSVLGGLIISLLVCLWNAWTNVLLVQAAQKCGQYDLGALLRQLPHGRRLEQVCNATIWASSFLVLVAYLVIFQDGLGELLGCAGTWRCSAPFLGLLGSLIVVPLLSLDLARLAFTSTLSVLANLFVIGLLCLQALELTDLERDLPNRPDFVPVCIFGTGRGQMTLVAVLVMGIGIQMNTLPMYVEMDADVRDVRTFAKLCYAAYFVVWAMFGAVATAGLMVYGSGVPSNVLLILPPSAAGTVARAGMLVVVISMYPLVVYPMTAPLLGLPVPSARLSDLSLLGSAPGSPLASALRSPLLGFAGSPVLAGSSRGPASPLRGSASPLRGLSSPFGRGLSSPFADGDSFPPSPSRPPMRASLPGKERTLQAARFGIVAGAWALAATGADLGKVNDVNGALTVLFFVVLCPSMAAFGLLREELGRCGRARVSVHFVVGLVLAALCFVWKGNFRDELNRACKDWW